MSFESQAVYRLLRGVSEAGTSTVRVAASHEMGAAPAMSLCERCPLFLEESGRCKVGKRVHELYCETYDYW
ncbi:MAG: hypothetical protein AAF975_08600, partial [Spirochaetota bacterium]